MHHRSMGAVREWHVGCREITECMEGVCDKADEKQAVAKT